MRKNKDEKSTEIMCCLYFTLFFRRAIEIDEEEDDKNVHSVPSQELNAAIADLSACLENLRTCNDLISKHGRALQSTLFDLENSDDLVNKTKLINERATIFRISSNAMINVRIIFFYCGVGVDLSLNAIFTKDAYKTIFANLKAFRGSKNVIGSQLYN